MRRFGRDVEFPLPHDGAGGQVTASGMVGVVQTGAFFRQVLFSIPGAWNARRVDVSIKVKPVETVSGQDMAISVIAGKRPANSQSYKSDHNRKKNWKEVGSRILAQLLL